MAREFCPTFLHIHCPLTPRSKTKNKKTVGVNCLRVRCSAYHSLCCVSKRPVLLRPRCIGDVSTTQIFLPHDRRVVVSILDPLPKDGGGFCCEREPSVGETGCSSLAIDFAWWPRAVELQSYKKKNNKNGAHFVLQPFFYV